MSKIGVLYENVDVFSPLYCPRNSRNFCCCTTVQCRHMAFLNQWRWCQRLIPALVSPNSLLWGAGNSTWLSKSDVLKEHEKFLTVMFPWQQLFFFSSCLYDLSLSFASWKERFCQTFCVWLVCQCPRKGIHVG